MVPPVMEIAETFAAPVVVKPLMVLLKKFWLPAAEVIPKILPAVVTFVIVFPDTLFVPPTKLYPAFNTVEALLPLIILLNVLFVIVFAGYPAVPPSADLKPPNVVAPVNVTFEKLFPVLVSEPLVVLPKES